jgi:hypothetical protein
MEFGLLADQGQAEAGAGGARAFDEAVEGIGAEVFADAGAVVVDEDLDAGVRAEGWVGCVRVGVVRGVRRAGTDRLGCAVAAGRDGDGARVTVLHRIGDRVRDDQHETTGQAGHRGRRAFGEVDLQPGMPASSVLHRAVEGFAQLERFEGVGFGEFADGQSFQIGEGVLDLAFGEQHIGEHRALLFGR